MKRGGIGAVYHVVGLLTCAVVVLFAVGGVDFRWPTTVPAAKFVQRRGHRFYLDGKAFYINGWNSYWLMDQSIEEHTRPRVAEMFRTGAALELTVCRTWAFNDGYINALQVSPGQFDERVFQALDRVIVEAQKHGVRMILSLANNLEHYGGKIQYVRWAWEEGVGSSASNDSFFFDPSIRSYFKTYLKAILTRKNHLSGIMYKDDPTILAWELMNEPRCLSDASGGTLQGWIEEMAGYVKSIDGNHLLTVGLEGFYGRSSRPEKLRVNPQMYFSNMGSDFIRNSKVESVDFASVHLYPDSWLFEAKHDEKMKFISKWMSSHIDDGEDELQKPILFTEFGISSKSPDFNNSRREDFYGLIYDIIYQSARNGGAGAGALMWQLMAGGMAEYNDDFGFVASGRASMYRLIQKQSCRLAELTHAQVSEKKSICS